MANETQSMRLAITGMDCAECAVHTEEAVRGVAGVREARVFLGAERLDVVYDPHLTDTDQIAGAVERAGYRVEHEAEDVGEARASDLAERLTGLFVAVVALLALVEIVGERLGLLDLALERLPRWNARYHRSVAVADLFPSRPGRLVEIRGLDRVRALPSFHRLRQRIPLGEPAGWASDGFRCPLFVILHHEDPGIVRQDVGLLRELVHISVEPMK